MQKLKERIDINLIIFHGVRSAAVELQILS